MNWRPQYLVVAMVLIACSFGYSDTISVSTSSNAISLTGTVSNPNDVMLYTFDVTGTSPSDVTVQSYSYGGGTNAAGIPIPAGGFEIGDLVLYSGSSASPTDELQGDFTQGTNTGCPPAGLDAGGYCGDISGTALLAPGIYTLAITVLGNSPNYSNGFTLGSGFTGNGQFQTNQLTLTQSYGVDITGNVVPVPEPATLALLGSGLLLASFKLRKRANSVKCEASTA